jgi:hypothetical protein
VTDVVAWLALIVALGSLLVSYLGYRQGRPALSATARISFLGDDGGLARTLASVLVVNSSSVAITIDDLSWNDDNPFAHYEVYGGPPLPFRLEGHSTQRWNLRRDGEVLIAPAVLAAERRVQVRSNVALHLQVPKARQPRETD